MAHWISLSFRLVLFIAHLIYLSVGRSLACLVIILCCAIAYIYHKYSGGNNGALTFTTATQKAAMQSGFRLWYVEWLLSGLEKFSRWVACLFRLGSRWQSVQASAVLPDALRQFLWRHCTALISSFNCVTNCIQSHWTCARAVFEVWPEHPWTNCLIRDYSHCDLQV